MVVKFFVVAPLLSFIMRGDIGRKKKNQIPIQKMMQQTVLPLETTGFAQSLPQVLAHLNNTSLLPQAERTADVGRPLNPPDKSQYRWRSPMYIESEPHRYLGASHRHRPHSQ